jgi:hypothetical protein
MRQFRFSLTALRAFSLGSIKVDVVYDMVIQEYLANKVHGGHFPKVIGPGRDFRET